MIPESLGAQARPEPSGLSTIVSITDMPNTAPADDTPLHHEIPTPPSPAPNFEQWTPRARVPQPQCS